ncbi:hypothetical protein [Bacteroides sp. 224]|uniref:hypothetical protein n=1 Tax=Bacteroides sp. 224 TaxID=2302936 RepID=UPI0013D2FA48|nr:hypothetical protein [Bacteroides sp. 224]NDV63985.1 hypothetical protein [Bacteroides sp. 224]
MKAVGNAKFCPKCSQTKNVNEFYKNAASRDGLQHYCKECEKKRGCTKANQTKKTNMILNIADFSDESLFAEIRKRGYSGELTYVRAISI